MAIDWGLIIVGSIAAAPGVLSWLTRNKSVSKRAEATAKRTTMDEFNSLYEEQRRQITECRQECSQLIQDRQGLQVRVNSLETEMRKVEIELNEERDRRKFLEQVIRMRGGETPS